MANTMIGERAVMGNVENMSMGKNIMIYDVVDLVASWTSHITPNM